MKRYTVIMIVTYDTGIGPFEETHVHRIKARDEKQAMESYPKHNVIAVVYGWPEVSGVDHKE